VVAHRSGVSKVTGAVADATGRSDEEVRLALVVAVAAAGLFTAIRFIEFLGDLGSDLFVGSRK